MSVVALSGELFVAHLKAALGAEGLWVTKGENFYAAPLLKVTQAERERMSRELAEVGFEIGFSPGAISGGVIRIRVVDAKKALRYVEAMNEVRSK